MYYQDSLASLDAEHNDIISGASPGFINKNVTIQNPVKKGVLNSYIKTHLKSDVRLLASDLGKYSYLVQNFCIAIMKVLNNYNTLFQAVQKERNKHEKKNRGTAFSRLYGTWHDSLWRRQQQRH